MVGVMADLLETACARFRSSTIEFPAVRKILFEELDDLAGRFANGLRYLGIEAGDHLVLHLPNSWQWIVAYHAVARMGAVVIPANILNSPEEINYMIADANAKAVILPGARVGLVRRPQITISVGQAEGSVPFEALLEHDYSGSIEVHPNDLFSICYTSGTTGKPKGAMLTHGNVFASVAMTATIHVRTSGDRIFSALPFPHVYGNVVLNSCLLTGGRLIAPARFDAGEALIAITRGAVTLFEGVPTMYYQLLTHANLSQADFSQVTRCTVGGQTIPRAKLKEIERIFGCPVLELWGMTELGGPAATHSPWWPPRHGSIGLPFPGTELRIAGPQDAGGDLPTNEAGELMLRGPLVMAGYWNNHGATASAIDADGWLATGDIATRDEDGYVYIVDRKKDMILTAGYNIYPAELEQVIAQHPSVAMVAVAGAPDEMKGEVAEAYIVLVPGASPDPDALITHCRSHLASYKIPRRIHFTDDLPKTSTGKIMRRALAAAERVPP